MFANAVSDDLYQKVTGKLKCNNSWLNKCELAKFTLNAI